MLTLQECPNTKEGTIFSLWNRFWYKHPEKYANEMLNYTSCGKIPKGLNDHNCSNTHSPLALFTNKITHWTWEMSLGKENFFLQPFRQILYSPHEFTNSTFTILIVINSNLECGLLCIKTDIWFLRLITPLFTFWAYHSMVNKYYRYIKT